LGGGLSGGLHEEVEGFSEGAGDLFGVVDDEALEQGLVEESAGAGCGVEVGLVEVADQCVCLFEALLDGLELQLGGVEPLFDGVELRGDAILFRLQEFEWYRSGVVGFEELASLVEELSLAGDESGAVADVVLAE